MSVVPAEMVRRHFQAGPHPLLEWRSVLDIGCGIRPQRVISADTHVCVDAHEPYLDHLRENGFTGQLIAGTWDEVLPAYPAQDFDALFALDAIEHWPKEDGWVFLNEARRVARTVVIFTPDGPFPQHYEDGESDAWGMDGGYWQTHRSAWTPADFEGWEIYQKPGFHTTDADGRELPEPIGAFWAVWEGDR